MLIRHKRERKKKSDHNFRKEIKPDDFTDTGWAL